MIDDRTCICSSHQQPNCTHWRMGKCLDKPMPQGVLRFPRNPGNGAREAMIDLFSGTNVNNPDSFADALIMGLWERGYKVVPLTDADR